MASRTNNLTLVLGVADRNFSAGLKKAQTNLATFAAGFSRAFGKKKRGGVDGMASSILNLATAIERLNAAVAKSPLHGFSAKVRRTSVAMNGARKATRRLNRRLSRTRAAAAAAGKGADRAALSMGRLRKSTARTAEAIRSTAVNLKFMIATMVGGAAAIGVVKFGADFEKRLGEIDTLLDANTVSIQRYQEQLIKLSQSTPKTLMDLSGALYQIISAGIPAVEGAGGAFDILTQSQKLAVGSISETKQSADLLITTMAAFKHENLGSAEAADKLTAIYQKGRTTIPQLSKAFGRAAPIAAQFGVSLDELGGLLIGLTRAGLNTNEAVTGIRAMMSSLAKPTNKTRELLELLNIEFGENAIQTKGFSGVLEDLIAKTGGSVEVLSQLFPNIRALLPAVIAAGDGFGGFQANVDSVTDSIGASDQAVLKQQKRFFFAAELLKSNFQGVIQQIAEKTLPGLTIMLSRLGGFLSDNREEIVSFGVQAMKFFGMIGSAGGQALFKTLKTIIEFLSSGFGKAVALIAVVSKLGLVFFGMGKAAVLSLGKALHLFFPAVFTEAGALAAGAFNGAFESASNSRMGRFFGGAGPFIRGILGFLGPLAIGAMIAKALFDGFSAAADEEAAQAGEELARKLKEAVQKAVAEAAAEFRRLQGIDAKDVEKTQEKVDRGTLFVDEGEGIGKARTLQKDLDLMLRSAINKRRMDLIEAKKKELKVTVLTAKQAGEVENALQEENAQIRTRVVAEHAEKHMKIIEARAEKDEKLSKAVTENLNKDIERQNKLLQDAKSKQEKGFDAATTHVGRQVAKMFTGSREEMLGMARRFRTILAGETEAERAEAEKVINEFIEKISKLESDRAAKDQDVKNQAKFIAGMNAERRSGVDSVTGKPFTEESARRFDKGIERNIEFQKTQQEDLRVLETMLAKRRQEFAAEFPRLQGSFLKMANALAQQVMPDQIEKTTAQITESFGEQFTQIAKQISQDTDFGKIDLIDESTVNKVAEARAELKKLETIKAAIQGGDFTGFFTTSYWASLGKGVRELGRDIINLSFIPERLRQLGQIGAREAAKTKTKDKRDKDKEPKVRKPPKANFDSLLNRLRKQRIRLEDKLQKMAIKTLKIANQRFQVESKINATVKDRSDTGEFNAENKRLLQEALKIRQDADMKSLNDRHKAEMDNLNREIETRRKAHEEQRRKNREDFEKETKKRFGRSAKNKVIRGDIENELRLIDDATESEISEAAKKRIKGRMKETDPKKQEEALQVLLEKRRSMLVDEGKLGEEIAKERRAREEKFQSERRLKELQHHQQQEKLEKDFFKRGQDHLKRQESERKAARDRAFDALKRNLELSGGDFQVGALKAQQELQRESNHLAEQHRSIQDRLNQILKNRTRMDGLHNADLKEQNELLRQQAEIRRKQAETKRAQEFAQKFGAGAGGQQGSVMRLARRGLEFLGVPSFDTKDSAKIFDQATAMSEAFKNEIAAASKDPETKKRLEAMGLSADPKKRAAFARKEATGSAIEMGPGMEKEMRAFALAEKFTGSDIAKAGLDVAIPGMGAQIDKLKQELFDNEPHMKMFEAAAEASAEFAKGNVGGLFEMVNKFAQKFSDELVNQVSGVATKLGSLIGDSFGKFAGDVFGKTVGPLLNASLSFFAEHVAGNIASALGSSMSIMTGGVADAFGSVSSEDRLQSVQMEARDAAKRNLSEGNEDVRSAAGKRVAELDREIASTTDAQKKQDLINQRREVLATMEEQLLENKRQFADSERQRVEDERENNPMNQLDNAFSRSIEMADKLVFDLPNLASAAIDGLIQNLPVLLDKMAEGLMRTVDAIADKIPTLLTTFVTSIINVIPKLASTLGKLIPALIKGILKALTEILKNLGSIIGPLVEMAVTAIIDSLIELITQLPDIAVALVEGVITAVEVLAEQAPRLISALITALPMLTLALISAIPRILDAIIMGLPDIFVAFGRGMFRAAIDFGKMIGRTFTRFASFQKITDSPAGLGAGLGAAIGFGASFIPGIGLGATALSIGGALLGGGIGSLFKHDGAVVKKGQRNPAMASLMRGLGAAQYADGGMVEMMSRSLSSNPLSGMKRAVDDVPAVLQAGEAVLNRQATAVLGEDTINMLNAGGALQAGDTSVTLNIVPNANGVKNAAAALLPMLIGGVNAEVDRPGSKLRSAINSSSGRPIGSMGVPMSKRIKV